MGPVRSLTALSGLVADLGLRISPNSLKRYSVEYGWQERVRAYDAERQAVEETPAAQVLRMNERQAALGQSAQDIARQAFAAILGTRGQVEMISPTDAIRLAKDGQQIERLAMGEATSRTEIALQVYAELVTAVAEVFIEANALPDADARARRFALGAQALIEAHAQGYPLSEARHVDQDADAADTATADPT